MDPSLDHVDLDLVSVPDRAGRGRALEDRQPDVEATRKAEAALTRRSPWTMLGQRLVPVPDADRIAEFEEVAGLMPDDPVVRFGLAGAYLEAGRAHDAVREFRDAIRLKPDYSAAHRGLGRALERAGRPNEAAAAYRRGLEVATQTGDLQTKKEIAVFLRRLAQRGVSE